ncbi:EAL domain-containing protein [Tepidicella xavieri]|uniref:PAS domain S-box-containing protein/diguanylate cyclase (GGDEF)-like protein n=1 Tax=Tepidicella xavieri TaxID=360241 RepID=A0A4R6U3M3_9BURK|nr:EAL domain-containing protein [Tepidicella xavieri]TDQ40621.1 PAS domain S-box-containing protein/diguanylate cyclase (GGDEF)-like protein [Tepidicella xavieri]
MKRSGLSIPGWLLAVALTVAKVEPASAARPGFDELFLQHDIPMLLIEPASGRIVDANPAAARFYRYDRDALLGMSIQQINTLTPQQVAEERGLAEREGRNFFIFRHRLADGDIRTVEVHSRPFDFDGQRLLHSVVLDITPGRHQAQDLWHYQQRLEELVDAQVQQIARSRTLQFWLLLSALLAQALVIGWLVRSIRRARALQAERETLLQALEQANARQKRTIEALAGSEALLERAQRIAHIGSWTLEADTGELIRSGEVARILGCDLRAAPTTYDGFLAMVHPDDRARFDQAFQQSLQEGQSRFDVDLRIVRRGTGEVRHVHVQGEHERSPEGRHVRSFGSMQDITERMVLQAALHALNAELARLSGQAFFRGVCQHLTQALGLDMAFVGRLDASGLRVQVVGGCDGDRPLEPFTYDLAGTPCENVMSSGNAVYPSEVQALFPDDEALVHLGVQSYIGNALLDKAGQPIGILVALGRQPLPPALSTLASPLLDLFVDRVASEMLRAEAEAQIRQQLAFQQLAAQASAALLGVDAETGFDPAVDECLSGLGRLMGLDRCYVFQFDESATWMNNTHEWCAPGIEPQRQRIRDVRVQSLSWWLSRFLSTGIVQVPDVEQLPPEARLERAEFRRRQARSVLTAALKGSDGRLIGFLGGDSVSRQRDWSADDAAMFGVLAGVIGSAIDRRRARQKLDQAASVFEHANEGILITDPEGRILDVNAAFTRITGYAREEVIGRNPRVLASGRHDAAFFAEMWESLRLQGHWSGEVWNRRSNGEIYAELLTISAVLDRQGQVQRYVGLFTDITALKEHQRQLEHIAHYDPLTGLPNRSLLADRLQQAMAQASRRGLHIAVAYIDLDGFKDINDRFGHDTGDRLLVELAQRMRQVLREGDTLARLGGDEFVAVLLDLADLGACEPLLARLLDAAAHPVEDEGRSLQVSASVGVSFYPQLDSVDADQLLRQADQAMYQAKLLGKNRYHLFDAAHDRDVRGRHESLERLREALRQQEFVLHYQPKVHMRTGQVVGAEALIRWQHPQQGLLAPAVFLPVLANHRLMVDLGQWVLDTALAQIEAWRAQGLHLPLSINVDAIQLQQPDFVDRLQQALERHPGVQSGDLELEILETSALEDVARIAETMQACAALGVGFALDDFGTGYSSLTYLRRLSVQTLKVDRSFVRDMLEDPDDLALLEGVLGLAKAFRRRAIAEGVETVAHGEMLLRMGCEWGQGYAIAKPLPAHEVVDWVRGWAPPDAWQAVPSVDHDDVPLLFAMVEHRAWTVALIDYLKGASRVLPSLTPADSRLGQWLEESGRVRHARRPEIALVESLHRESYRQARELVARLHEGAPAWDEAGCARLESLQAALQETLRSLMQ